MVTKWGGIVLMLFPYALSKTWQLYAAVFGLCIGIYIFTQVAGFKMVGVDFFKLSIGRYKATHSR